MGAWVEVRYGWQHLFSSGSFAEETIILLKNGSEIKHGGAPGAFEREFVYMETILEETRKIIAGSNISLEGLENLMEKLRQLRYVDCRLSNSHKR